MGPPGAVTGFPLPFTTDSTNEPSADRILKYINTYGTNIKKNLQLALIQCYALVSKTVSL
jgi:hypothetical protein